MLSVFSNIFLSSFITVLWGIIFCRYFFNKKNQYNFNYAEYGFFGIILISFFSLFFNFFIELNVYITSIFFFPLLFFFNKEIFNKKKINKFLIYSLIFSIIGTILISYDNVYRPDAGRYHLPYTRILNDFKIFVGIANIDPFYGLSSIFQYTAAFYNNFLFNDTGVLLPLVLISIYFFNFLILEFLKVKNGNNIFYKLFIFFCGSFYFIEMNRYSNYGNDVPAQIFFFFLVSLILRNDFVKNNIDNFKIITLISIYCFLLRPFFIFSLIFPIYFWFKNYYFKKIKAVPFFALLFFTFWIIKNILITGCAIYPAKHTCLEKLSWYSDKPEYKVAAQNLGEFSKLHAKGWPDISNGEKYINYMNKREEKKNYLSDLNWISKENLENYLKLYFKKFDFFLSVTFLIFSISILFFYKKKQIIYEMNIPSNIKIVFFVSFIGTIFMTFNLPLPRYSSSYIVIIYIIIYFKIFQKILLMVDIKKFNQIIISLFALLIFSFLLKNTIRVYKFAGSSYYKAPWPRIYNYDFKISAANTIKNNFPIKNFYFFKDNIIKIYFVHSDDFYMWSGSNPCLYNASPCTVKSSHYNQFKISKKFGYYFVRLN